MLDGKVAIVTGAGAGLGRAHALELARLGARVVVNDIGAALDGSPTGARPADEVVEEIRAAGGEAVANYDDVADWEGARRLVEGTIERFGRLDVLVNNAGILRDAMSFNTDEAAWDAVIRVHLKGHFAPTYHAARYWRARAKGGEPTSGRIINTSSEAGLFGNIGQANYSAAKAGIAMLTVVLARELHKYGVTANAIAPRARTRMTAGLLGEQAPPEGFDPLAPENVSPLVAWLASDEAAHVTGQIFIVWGDTISVVRLPTIAGSISAGGRRWEAEELSAATKELFARWGPGLPPMAVPEV